MNASDRELTLWREALTSLPPALGAECPEPERIWEAARGELPPGEVSELADHTLACPDCAVAWRLAVELGDEAPGDAVPERRPAARRWTGWGLAAAAAAAVVLIVALPRTPIDDPAPIERQAGGPRLSSLVPADEALARDAALLAWTALEEGTRYDLRVTTEDFRVVATAEDLTAAEFLIPTAKLAPLPQGTRILWHVKATLPGDLRPHLERTFTARIE